MNPCCSARLITQLGRRGVGGCYGGILLCIVWVVGGGSAVILRGRGLSRGLAGDILGNVAAEAELDPGIDIG